MALETAVLPHDLLEAGYDTEMYPLFPVVETEIGRLGASSATTPSFPRSPAARPRRLRDLPRLDGMDGPLRPSAPRLVDRLLPGALDREHGLRDLHRLGRAPLAANEMPTSGGSFICDYEGRVLAQSQGSGETMTYATLDIDALRDHRQHDRGNNLLAHLRLSAYDYWRTTAGYTPQAHFRDADELTLEECDETLPGDGALLVCGRRRDGRGASPPASGWDYRGGQVLRSARSLLLKPETVSVPGVMGRRESHLRCRIVCSLSACHRSSRPASRSFRLHAAGHADVLPRPLSPPRRRARGMVTRPWCPRLQKVGHATPRRRQSVTRLLPRGCCRASHVIDRRVAAPYAGTPMETESSPVTKKQGGVVTDPHAATNCQTAVGVRHASARAVQDALPYPSGSTAPLHPSPTGT